MKTLTALLLAFCPALAFSQVMLPPHKLGDTSYKSPCLPFYSVATDGITLLTGMSGANADFIIKIHADNEATDAEYDDATDIETITTIGTYQAPTTNARVRFGQCSTAGTYQLMLHNDHVNETGSAALSITLSDTGISMMDAVWVLNLNVADLDDIRGEIEDSYEEYEVETGVTLRCYWATDLAEGTGSFDRTASGGGGPGETIYYAPDGTTNRIEGTLSDDGTDRQTTRNCTF
jgi:hypothetical protein